MLESRRSGTFNRIPADKAKKYGLDKIFDAIRQHCMNVIPETDLIVFANTLMFIAQFHRMLAEDAPEYAQFTNKRSNLIYDYIDRHYMEDINTGSVANMMFMSSSNAERIFKRETGMSIKAYITFRRVSAAKDLMMEGQKAMSIYSRCGFHDYSTFYRSFVKYVGMKPDEFKHRYDNKNNKTQALFSS